MGEYLLPSIARHSRLEVKLKPGSSKFSRKKKNKASQQSPGAFASTPTLGLVTHVPRSAPNHSRPIVNPPGPSTNAGSSELRRPVLRVGQAEKDVADRWEQQLLAWRLSAYEDARKWEIIE